MNDLLLQAFDADNDGSVWKSWTAVGGIYLFYAIDRALHLCLEIRAVSTDVASLEMMKLSKEMKLR